MKFFSTKTEKLMDVLQHIQCMKTNPSVETSSAEDIFVQFLDPLGKTR